MYKRFIKRGLDIFLSTLGIIILAPFLLLICIFIMIDSKGPIIFTQKRVGKDSTHFNIYKFRTMKVDTPKEIPTHLLDNPNFFITNTGRFLRKTSLDELPQLFNILRGDMSIIGPRPALWNQYDFIEERDKYEANSIRPGLTGSAQISGRDELEISLKAKLDGDYTQNISFILDVKCFIGTIFSVVKSEGVVEGNKDSSKEVDE